MIFDAPSIKIAWWCNTAFYELDQMLNSFSLVIITFSLLHTTSVLVGVEWSNKLARKSSLSLGQPACKNNLLLRNFLRNPLLWGEPNQNRLRNEIYTCSFSTFSFLMLVPVRSRTVSFGQRFCREKRLWCEFIVIPFLNQIVCYSGGEVVTSRCHGRKFLDLNNLWCYKYDRKTTKMACFSFLCMTALRKKKVAPYFPSIVRQCKWPSLSRKIVEMQMFWYHGNLTSHPSSLL